MSQLKIHNFFSSVDECRTSAITWVRRRNSCRNCQLDSHSIFVTLLTEHDLLTFALCDNMHIEHERRRAILSNTTTVFVVAQWPTPSRRKYLNGRQKKNESEKEV